MGVSFFLPCPVTWGISVPLQTLRTSNSSLSSRAFVRVRRFEATYRLVFFRAWQEKRHPHAHAYRQGRLFDIGQRPGAVFKGLKCYENLNNYRCLYRYLSKGLELVGPGIITKGGR